MSVHIKVAHCTIHRSIVRIRTYVYIVLVSRLAHVYIDLLVCRAALNFAMERLILLAAIVAVASAAAGSFNYEDQDAWANIPDASSSCGSGRRQSPIEISSEDTAEGDDLIDLMLSGWDERRQGIFANTGTSVKFTPDEGESVATTRNSVGMYNVLQFHMHWGQNDTVGSEHVVDDDPASAEIHFVHRKNSGPENAGDAYAVVGVMAVADDTEISGAWSSLNVEDIEDSGGEANTSVRFSDFLPDDLSYYHYEGSLTTPGCNEIVQWFLLQNTISIPKAYLEQLRMVQDEGGHNLTFNYRNTQDLNGRNVYRHPADGGSSGVKPMLSVTLLSLLICFLSCRL